MRAAVGRPRANGPAPAALESERWRRFREWCEAVIREQGPGDREQARPQRRRSTPGFVYFVTDGSGLVKIGRTKDLVRRLREMQTSNAGLTIVEAVPVADSAAAERALHKALAEFRKAGEWFDPAGNPAAFWALVTTTLPTRETVNRSGGLVVGR